MEDEKSENGNSEDNKSKYLKYGLHVAVLAGVIYAIVKYVNGPEVLKAFQNFTHIYLPFMLSLALIYLLLKGGRFVLLMSPFLEELKKRVVYKGYIAGQAAALIPGGVAARAGLMKQVGVPVSESSVPVAFHSGWDQVILILSGLIAALWFPGARLPISIILGVLAVVAALLLIPATRHWFEKLADKAAARAGVEDQWHHFLEAIPKVLTLKIMLGCFVITVIAFSLQVITLGLTLRGLDLEVSIPTLFLAFIVPTLLGRLVPVPGGFGVTEASMVGFLTSTAQLSTNTTVAAAIIFRIVTIVGPALLGAVIYYFFWKGEEEVDGRVADPDSDEKQTAAATAANN